ncbi:unnamed protein product, partial [Brachionus calyciflorus]
MDNQSKKRKIIDINTKIMIINKSKEGKSTTSIAKEFGLSNSTVSTILNNKEKIKENYQSRSVQPESKRIRKSKFEDLDEALDLWFNDAKSYPNISLSGYDIQQQALKYASMLGYKEIIKPSQKKSLWK